MKSRKRAVLFYGALFVASFTLCAIASSKVPNIEPTATTTAPTPTPSPVQTPTPSPVQTPKPARTPKRNLSNSKKSLSLSSASVVEIPGAEKNDNYELIACFNRPLTKKELEPASGYAHQYGIKYSIKFANGWREDEKPRNKISIVQSGLTQKENQCYYLTQESSHHPLRGYNEEVDLNFTKENIESISVTLYERDKNDKKSDYQVIDKKDFPQLTGRKAERKTSPSPSPSPSSTSTPEPTPERNNLPSCVNSDCNCSDFSTQAQAQRVLEAYPGDPHRLDRDKDNIACESLP